MAGGLGLAAAGGIGLVAARRSAWRDGAESRGAPGRAWDALCTGYEAAPPIERRAAEGLSVFALTVAITRAITYLWDQREPARPPGGQDSTFGIHHGLPAAGVAVGAAVGALLSTEESSQRWLTTGFAAAAAVALDEIALLVEGEDVYWEREWVPLVEVVLAASGAVGLAARFLVAGRPGT